MSPARHQRVKELFLAACELDGGAAADYLARECGDDAALRREVEELLGVDTAGVPVLEKRVTGAGEPDAGARVAPEELARLATRASARAYELGAELGRGGMGRVLRARDVDLHRDLALKVSLDRARVDDGTPGAGVEVARFLAEARVTARLDHPGIVPVHDLGLDAEGRPYFAMKLVQGRELAEVLRLAREGDKRWSTTRLVGVLQKVCEAVSFAHAKGVVHRDLKPANVMVGDFGEVYVMDWGISRVVGEEVAPRLRDGGEALDGRPEHDALTRAGSILGTPYGMAPEQARGEPAGPLADVYAVGAMLYEVLAGRRPFDAPGSGSAAAGSVLMRILEGPPEALRRAAPRASAELVSIAERAMARRPEDRYQGMGALADDLRAYLEGRVVRAHRTGPWIELRKWVARNRLASASIAAGLLALAAGLAWSRRVEAEGRHELDLASDYFRARVARDSVGELWPATAAMIPALDGWLSRAEALLARRAEHSERLRRLAASPPPDLSELDRQRALVTYLDELEGGAGQGAGQGVGLVAEVRARREFAGTIEERSVSGADASERWRATAASVLAGDTHPAYVGLALAPQVGLLPLGADPLSGLHEFAHLESGAPAQRGAGGQLVLEDETGIVLVLVPGGTFHLGASATEGEPNFDGEAEQNEHPVRAVTLRPYFLSKYELTQAQWVRLTGANPSRWLAGAEEGLTPMNPVEQVSWERAHEVLARRGLTLPTEARWEYACRAGTGTRFVLPVSDLPRFLNVADQSYQETFHPTYPVEPFDDGFAYHAPVGSLSPNPFGLHDMLGNVFEWTSDHYGSHVIPRSEVDGASLGPDAERPAEAREDNRWWSADYRVIRGGSFELPMHYARASHRVNFAPTSISHSIGVRPARDVTPGP